MLLILIWSVYNLHVAFVSKFLKIWDNLCLGSGPKVRILICI